MEIYDGAEGADLEKFKITFDELKKPYQWNERSSGGGAEKKILIE